VDRRLRHDLGDPVSALSNALRMAVVACAAWMVFGPTSAGGAASTDLADVHSVGLLDDEVDAQLLYRTRCAACHARDGTGVEGRGPALIFEGRAAADFVLRTGRMPLPDIDMQPVRKDPPFSEEEIVALVDYVGALGVGVDIPDVDPRRGSVAEGAELYRLNCAACHVASGAGSVIGAGRTAPALTESTPTQVGEAILVGPGAMPVFGALSSDDIDSVAAYVVALQEEGTTGADALGGVGPVAEGLAAWLLGVLPLVALTRWIGSPNEETRDETADDETADRTTV
jgi:ubiquinol-cytochrome c reductase cytochrome c subunit